MSDSPLIPPGGSLAEFLESKDLGHYLDKLVQIGFAKVADFLELGDGDINDIATEVNMKILEKKKTSKYCPCSAR